MDCPRAVERLLRLGVPATVINPMQDDRGEAIKVAETVQYFITAMDGVRWVSSSSCVLRAHPSIYLLIFRTHRLEQRAVDELQPMVSDIVASLNRVPQLPSDFAATKKLQEWWV